MAIIGPNGAGKSTLLLAIAGILEPTEGAIVTRGKVSTLLTLGAGFENELTGRDNIDLAGAFLGIDQRQMDELTPSIIEFADIGQFIDAPVQTYSTGMRARLGFLDRDRDHARHPAPRRGARDRRPDVPGAQPGPRPRARRQGQGDRPGDSRPQLRDRVLQPGDPPGEGPDHRTRASPPGIVDLYRERVAEQKLLAEEEAQRFARPPVIAPTS